MGILQVSSRNQQRFLRHNALTNFLLGPVSSNRLTSTSVLTTEMELLALPFASTKTATCRSTSAASTRTSATFGAESGKPHGWSTHKPTVFRAPSRSITTISNKATSTTHLTGLLPTSPSSKLTVSTLLAPSVKLRVSISAGSRRCTSQWATHSKP